MGVDSLGPAGLQVLISELTGVAEEMGAVLRRASFSPNIKERADCSAALFTADGELLVQAEHIPVHLGSMPASVAAAIAAGIDLAPGDQIALNDPFAGGTHLNDITLVAPCFLDGRIVGWAANRAHHADVGGMTPGSIPPEATEIYQEGLRIPPVRLSPEVVALLLANSRTPVERRGDLDAQVGANTIGVERLSAIIATGAPVHDVLDYGERRMRAALAQLSDGTWQVDDAIDSFGPRPSQQQPVAIRVTLTKRGEQVSFDFTGTDRQQPGNVNAVEAVTYSAVAFSLRCATDPTIPANGGTLRPIGVIAPAGTIVAARPPAAVGAGNVEVSQRVADICLRALAQAAPGRVGAAGQGTMNNVILSGTSGWVYYETIGGGQGGRPGRAGMNGVHTAMTNTADTPTEALERAYPLRVLRYRLRHGSGGAGAAAGGDGIERVIQVLEDATVTVITERRTSAPPGLNGGEPGAVGENWLWPHGHESVRRPILDKTTLTLAAGDAIQLLTPGGGGCGAPSFELPQLRTPAQARAGFRGGLRTPTSGWCDGYVQANLIAVPEDWSDDLRLFANHNPRPCPIVAIGTPGDWNTTTAPGADLRTDLPGYQLYEKGKLAAEAGDALAWWRDDLVAFLVGCSFTFEWALFQEGVPVRHRDNGRNVPMYRTNRPCQPGGRIHGPLVVSLRGVPHDLVPTAIEVSGRYPGMHGAPLPDHDPAALGIANLDRPDFGDPPILRPGDTKLFWACGVTMQAAAMAAEIPYAITHAPGQMFITDIPNSEYETGRNP